jgi:hypothetical protein
MVAYQNYLNSLTPAVFSFLASVGDAWRSWLPPDAN